MTRQNHPADFRARIRYRTTEPASVTSIGVSFDVTQNLRDWQAVYTHTKELPAIHAFHRKKGRNVHSREAIINTSFEIGDLITLDIAVRGSQLNVRVAGELKIAYRMPLLRQKGKFALWCHGSITEFHQLWIDQLPDNLSLAKQTTKNIRSPFIKPSEADLKNNLLTSQFAVEQAQRKQQIAKAKLVSVQARLATDRARLNQVANQFELAKAAAKAEKQAALMLSEHELFAARHELKTARDDSGISAEKKQKAIQAAEKNWRALRKNMM